MNSSQGPCLAPFLWCRSRPRHPFYSVSAIFPRVFWVRRVQFRHFTGLAHFVTDGAKHLMLMTWFDTTFVSRGLQVQRLDGHLLAISLALNPACAESRHTAVIHGGERARAHANRVVRAR